MFILPSELSRKFISEHEDVLFLTGNSLNGNNHVGESAEFYGLDNLFYIPVKVLPCMDDNSFFTDILVDAYEMKLEDAGQTFEFKKNRGQFKQYKHIVPNPMSGRTDWSGPLKTRAPKCYSLLTQLHVSLCTPWQVDWRIKI